MMGDPVTLADTRVQELEAASGERYRLSLWTPPGEPPPRGWPAIHVLDANALFATFVEALKRSSRRPDATGIAPAAVVGIAHAGDALFATERRFRDYTFGPSVHVDKTDVGGGEAFAAFLDDRVSVDMASLAPLDPDRRILFGHSLAGYFVLQMLLRHRQAFETFVAISPSIWWDESSLRQRLAALDDSRARVFMAVGEWESVLPPWQRDIPGREALLARRRERRMVERARDMAGELETRLGRERVTFQEFPQEDHASVLMVAIQRALRFALPPKRGGGTA
ncbi:alpha/beta hydrolase [Salinicola rhizosphaerae]|uniref:Ferri-bacillibactin esterase BesA n=1 Tax=Salinicola rhizosphaerae TaxID=1443141 RepID=A0ABQ3E8Z7_9GAMM|nr:alpha/beta hydrolase-fold protein [Salinicola rhizosphaerae]GHB28690.1 ferri-bacillibactin esterase BesA [Salinicola rhizosphaerae]